MPRFSSFDSYRTVFPVLLDTNEETDIVFIPTVQTFGGPGVHSGWPLVPCHGCHTARPFFDFLHLNPQQDGIELRMAPSGRCIVCEPRQRVRIELRPKMRFYFGELRQSGNRPIDWFDKKAGRWKDAKRAVFRIMDKAKRPLELRMQPYENRLEDYDGNRYQGC